MTSKLITSTVKICGLTRPQDVSCAIEHGASYLGFIVEAKSARRLSVAQAAKLAAPAKGITARVAVTVNASQAILKSIMADMQPDYIQCHGDESPQQLAYISKTYGVKTIKAIAVSDMADMKRAETYSGVCDFILYDAKPPKTNDGSEAVRGGHGLSFDWNILTKSPLPKVWALAGGLTPDNIANAMALTNAPIYDVSSGVEAAAGIKDPLKIKAFMEAVQNG